LASLSAAADASHRRLKREFFNEIHPEAGVPQKPPSASIERT
jgi:hypothetical protein